MNKRTFLINRRDCCVRSASGRDWNGGATYNREHFRKHTHNSKKPADILEHALGLSKTDDCDTKSLLSYIFPLSVEEKAPPDEHRDMDSFHREGLYGRVVGGRCDNLPNFYCDDHKQR